MARRAVLLVGNAQDHPITDSVSAFFGRLLSLVKSCPYGNRAVPIMYFFMAIPKRRDESRGKHSKQRQNGQTRHRKELKSEHTVQKMRDSEGTIHGRTTLISAHTLLRHHKKTIRYADIDRDNQPEDIDIPVLVRRAQQ